MSCYGKLYRLHCFTDLENFSAVLALLGGMLVHLGAAFLSLCSSYFWFFFLPLFLKAKSMMLKGKKVFMNLENKNKPSSPKRY